MPKSDEVHITARHTIQCAHEASLSPLGSHFRLGPLDNLVWPFVPIEGVYVYRKPATTPASEFLPAGSLRRAASHLLDYYPHLTGRLEWTTDIKAWGVGNLGTGAQFLEAQCPNNLDDLISPSRSSRRLLLTDLPGSGSAVTPPFDKSTDGITANPILAIQHNRFACGGVVLGIRVHHMVCDANGYFQLVRNLADLYRQLRSPTRQNHGGDFRPTLTDIPEIYSYLRTTEELSPEEQQAALQFQPSVLRLIDPAEEEEPAPDPVDSPSAPVVGRVIRFSGERLAEIKASATNPDGSSWVSTFEALSAFLFQRVYQAKVELARSQGIPTSEAAKAFTRGFWGSIDVRAPDRLHLPPNYFPNAIYPAYDYFSHHLLAEEPLWKVTGAIHDLFRSVGPETMRNTTRWIAVQPDRSRIRVDYKFGGGSFTVSQFSKHGMYKGVHFEFDDTGNPVNASLVSRPFTEVSLVDGLGIMLSTEEELETLANAKPALDVNLTVSEPVWEILDRDPEFCQAE